MEYKVTTALLKHFAKGYYIDKKTYKVLIQEGCPASWFEAIPEVEAGQYWKWDDDIIRIQRVGPSVFDWKSISGVNSFSADKEALLREGTLLSDDEVEQAIREEAKRRGFKNGEEIRDLSDGKIKKLKCGYIGGYQPINDKILFAGKTIYQRGNFAEIIEDEWKVKKKGMSDEYFVKNSNGDIVSGVNFYFTKKEAEAIKNALNELS